MQKSQNFLPFFLFFFGLSLLLILLGRTGIINSLTSFINKQAFPIRSSTIEILTLKEMQNKQINSLLSENSKLRREVLEKQNLINENKALRSQFENTSLSPQNLIPAKVIGAPGFIPGVSPPEYLIIDKGSADGLSLGAALVMGNYLVGKIITLNDNSSKVELVGSKNSSFTAKIVPLDGKQINGIIKGKGETLIFDNVLLSDNFKKDDLVLTKGDIDENGLGYPPDLIVGRVVSIEKKSTELFQKAAVESFVDFKNLETVFVIK